MIHAVLLAAAVAASGTDFQRILDEEWEARLREEPLRVDDVLEDAAHGPAALPRAPEIGAVERIDHTEQFIAGEADCLLRGGEVGVVGAGHLLARCVAPLILRVPQGERDGAAFCLSASFSDPVRYPVRSSVTYR